MLKIRLARIGRKNDPTFRVVVTQSTNGPKTGKHVEILGNHNPKTDITSLLGERILYWMSKGAQVSDTMHNLLINQKIITGKKINVLPRKSPIKNESEVIASPATPVVESTEEVVPEVVEEKPEEKVETEVPLSEAPISEAEPVDAVQETEFGEEKTTV